MERIKRLDRYQKGVLLFMAAMVLIFTAIYPITIAREGFAYNDTILIPSKQNGNTIYSGKIHGEQANFTVSADRTVKFQYDDKTYGPYTAKEDPTAIPKDSDMGELMTGVELRNREEIIFRGGVLNLGDRLWLYNEDGSWADMVSATTSYGNAMYENEDIIDSMEPPASTILDLMAGPELTHKGEWLAWFCGVLVCIITAVSILFADELFRWNLSLRIRNADRAEPSDWEIAGRHIGWTLLSITALILFIAGLQ